MAATAPSSPTSAVRTPAGKLRQTARSVWLSARLVWRANPRLTAGILLLVVVEALLISHLSHRFSTVRMADHILDLSGGRVVESGSHADLMARNGEYARLYRMQASRFREG